MDNSTATQAYPERMITTFFSPITPTNATSQLRDTQIAPQPGHNKGVTIGRAIKIRTARRLLSSTNKGHYLPPS